ncbi:MAG TPA: pyridoxal phosphate-dependent aminotransferase [Vicinamibacterales bacterium]|nr:pyridoxal phosphate-dependent aminotransferase [Vicinamibacterales bacterium]
MNQSHRLAAVQSPIIPVVSRWIAETPGTVSLGQGVVSYGPPDAAVEALRAFPTAPSDHRYGDVEGEPTLLALIEEKLRRENGIEVSGISRVVVTAGGNQAFMNAILAITDPGDEVILQVPYYFNHEMAIEMAGAREVPVATDHQCKLDVAAIEAAITVKTRAVVTVSPNNPTGVVYPEASLRAVNDLCRGRGLFHIHDEVYEYFTYGDARHFSPGSIKGAAGHTVSLYSLSKAFGMASWRMGYMVIPEVLWDAVNKIQDTVIICPPLVSQHVAVAALQIGRSFCSPHVERLNGIRVMMAERLSQPGVPCDVPPALGAFYYFLRVHTSMDALMMTERLIREHRVAVIPGPAFGATEGCHLRVSYGALDAQTTEEGINRLVSGVKELSSRV